MPLASSPEGMRALARGWHSRGSQRRWLSEALTAPDGVEVRAVLGRFLTSRFSSGRLDLWSRRATKSLPLKPDSRLGVEP